MMLFPKSDIKEHLKSLGLKKDDIVMFHADAGVAAQYINDTDNSYLINFIDELISYFSYGTVIVPTFTYSATKKEIFDPETTPSEVGLFSEQFRLKKGVIRSSHPIFSIGAIGDKAEYFTTGVLNDCFGNGTFFDRLYKKNAKIITLGCALERITFVHYIEQKMDVSYRYLKSFDSYIRNQGKIRNMEVTYFVRRLDFDTTLNFKPLEKMAISVKKLSKRAFGRYLARSITAVDFFQLTSMLIECNEYALINEGKI